MKMPGLDVIAPYSLGANLVLAVICGFLMWRLVDARSDIKEEIGRCNADKLESILMSERLVHEQEQLASDARTEQLARELEEMKSAKDMAEETSILASGRLKDALAAIRNPEGRDACLDTVIPDDRIRRLRQ